MREVPSTAATFQNGGIAPGWLWAWVFVTPAIGTSPPVIALMRVLKRLLPKPTPPR